MVEALEQSSQTGALPSEGNLSSSLRPENPLARIPQPTAEEVVKRVANMSDAYLDAVLGPITNPDTAQDPQKKADTLIKNVADDVPPPSLKPGQVARRAASVAFAAASVLTQANPAMAGTTNIETNSGDNSIANILCTPEVAEQDAALASVDSGIDSTTEKSSNENVIFFVGPDGQKISVTIPGCDRSEGEPQVEKDAIDKAIQEWTTKDPVEGRYPVDSMPYRFTDTSFVILNVFEPWREKYDFKTKTGMGLQGKLIGYEVVNGYVFIHLGFEDYGPSHDSVSVLRGENTRFTMPFNIGKLDGNKVVQSWRAITDNFLEGIADLNFYSTEQMVKGFLPENQGETVAGLFFPFKMDAKSTPSLRGKKFRNQIRDNNAAIDINRAMVTSFFEMNNFDPKKRKELKDIDFPPEVARLINGRVDAENFDPADYPFLLSVINK